MAVSFRSYAAASGVDDLLVSKPAGTVEGDMMIAFAGKDSVGNTLGMNDPGWTRVKELGLGATMRGGFWFKEAGINEPASYEFNVLGTSGSLVATIFTAKKTTNNSWNLKFLTEDNVDIGSTLITQDVLAEAGDMMIAGFLNDDGLVVTSPPADMTFTEKTTLSTFSLDGYYQDGLPAGVLNKSITYTGPDNVIGFTAVLSDRAPVTVPLGPAIIRRSRTKQPPRIIEQFDQQNFFGKHCIFALIPGWGYYSGAGASADGVVSSVGQQFTFKETYVGTGGSMERVHGRYGHLGQLTVLRTLPVTHQQYIPLIESGAANLGIRFADSTDFTILTIIKPNGDGRAGGAGDPRIFTKDLGTAEADHDLMLGIVDVGQEARVRVRTNGATTTVVTTGSAMTPDALCLIAAGIRIDESASTFAWLRHVNEDGIVSANTGVVNAAGYDPRTTTAMVIGSTAGALDNGYDGDIIGIWAFDRNLDNSTFLRKFFANPWQVFKPRTIYLGEQDDQRVVVF